MRILQLFTLKAMLLWRDFNVKDIFPQDVSLYLNEVGKSGHLPSINSLSIPDGTPIRGQFDCILV